MSPALPAASKTIGALSTSHLLLTGQTGRDKKYVT